jgi:general stress protein 26
MAETDSERVWRLMEKIAFCMFSSWTGEKLRSRPMGAFVRPQEGVVYFLSDARAHTDEEIRKFPQVCLAFADTSGQKYVSVSGTTQVSNDRRKIKELWSLPAKVWWDGPDDPNIRLVTVRPEEAEFWDSPGTVGSSIKMAAAVVTGTHPDPGEHRKVAM